MIEKHHISSLEGKNLEDALKSDFDLEITNTTKITKGYSNQVYKGNIAEQIVFVRMNKNPDIFESELLGYKIFEEKGIPVPKVLAYQEAPKSIGLPTMIMSSAFGKSISESNLSLEQKDIIYEKVGNLLRKINEVKTEGFGPVKVVENKFVGKFESWKKYDESRGEHRKKVFDFAVEQNYITGEDIEKVKKIYDEIDSIKIEQPSLLHNDIHRGHVFVEGTDLSGVIDLGALMSGDPRHDIATSLAFQTPREQECFKKGYGPLAYDPMVDKYLVVRLIQKIHFRSQNNINGNLETLVPMLKDTLEKLS